VGDDVDPTDPDIADNQMICKTKGSTGSRLRKQRICKTRAQWAFDRQQASRDLNRTITRRGGSNSPTGL